MQNSKAAIIADWLPTYGGAEHVVAQIAQMFPGAPIFTTVAKRKKLGPLRTANIHTDPLLQFLYGIVRDHKILLPLMPKAVERIDLRGYDLIVSSSHAVAKGVIPPPGAKHVCYCHTPMRYAWEMENEYLHDFGVPRLLKPLLKNYLKKLRRWDLTTAQRVDVFIANSVETQERIKRTYNRESIVVPPPVEDRFYETELDSRAPRERDGFLALGRLVPYKRFDLLIEAANILKFPLKIAGTGDDFARLKRLAGPTVQVLGYVDDDKLPALYAQCSALLFPQHEDAGVALREAMACGTPVIAYGKGGALDVVEDGATGILFAEQTVASLNGALARFATLNFDPETIRNHAQQWTTARFAKSLMEAIG